MEALKEWWAVLFGLVTAIGWLFRLEAAVKVQNRDIEYLKSAREHDLRAAKEARDATNNKLDDVRGDMKIIQDDIKTLLRRGHNL